MFRSPFSRKAPEITDPEPLACDLNSKRETSVTPNDWPRLDEELNVSAMSHPVPPLVPPLRDKDIVRLFRERDKLREKIEALRQRIDSQDFAFTKPFIRALDIRDSCITTAGKAMAGGIVGSLIPLSIMMGSEKLTRYSFRNYPDIIGTVYSVHFLD